MLRRWFLVLAGVLVAFVVLALAIGRIAPQATRHAMPQPGPVVVIGVPAAQWSQISQKKQPGIYSLLQIAATGTLSPRATTTPTCSADAWLSLSAGSGADANCTIPTPTVRGQGATVPGWSKVSRANDDGNQADIGLLAAELTRNKQCVAAVGKGATLAAADRTGKVSRYFAAPTAQALSACPVTFVDLGTGTEGAAPTNLDRALQPVFTHISAGTTVLITGLSDGTQTRTAPRLLMAVGPQIKRGAITSTSTRQPGFVIAADITSWLLQRTKPTSGGSPLAVTFGSPLTVQPNDDGDALVLQDRKRSEAALTRAQKITTPYAIASGLLAVLVLGLGLWRWRARRTPPRWLAPAAVTVGALPVASWLASAVPWWAGGPTTLWFLLALVVAAALVVSVAYAGPWRDWAPGPALVVAGITVAVIALDVITGSRLQLLAPQGLQPLLGGRYFGMGNAGFGFFASAALLLAGLVAMRLVWWDDADENDTRLAAATVGGIGVAAAVIDAAPAWGADFGGPPAILLATAAVVALILTIRLSLVRIALACGVVVALVGTVALIDWQRAPDARTHLGRFVQQVLDGRAGEVIASKLGANLDLLFSSPVAPLVPIALVLTWIAVLRPASRFGRPLAWLWDELPLLRWACVGLLVCWSVAFLLNDSGVGVPATGAQLAVPLLVGAAAAAWRAREVAADR